jgi:integrase
MAKPWKKTGKWPYTYKDGVTKTYQVGFYDHDGAERSKSFPRVKGVGGADDWMKEYVQAERRGKASLERFLLDLDAADANPSTSGRTMGEVIQPYFAAVAPWEVKGLAKSTFSVNRNIANRHLLGKPGRTPRGETLPPLDYAVDLAKRPAADFNDPSAPRSWLTEMERAGTSDSVRERAWKVLSGVLTWAANSEAIPEVETNGCVLATKRNGAQRRSERRGGTGESGTRRRQRRRGAAVRSWALSPVSAELVRVHLLRRVKQRDPILPLRDATIATLQYGLCLRDQEVFGMRWRNLDSTELDDPDLVLVDEVLTWDELDEGKTSGAVRETHCPGLLREDLAHWKRALRKAGHSTRDVDFVIPGSLGGEYFDKETRAYRPIGIYDEESGTRHYSSNMAKKYNSKFFKVAVKKAAESGERYADILGATPYALRRGGISLRLRTEDAQIVAEECGTSLQMLDKHYAFALKDLDRLNRLPMDEEWRLARAAVEKQYGVQPRLRVVAA